MYVNGYILEPKAIKQVTLLLLENTQIDPLCHLYNISGNCLVKDVMCT